jgi:hypothetical protein
MAGDMQVKAQKPAEGILSRHSWGDAKRYTVTCECSSAECEHNVWVEADDLNVSVITYTQQKTKWWELNRWQKMWTLLTKGYLEYEAVIVMSKQQALNYAEVLKLSIKDVEEFRKQKNDKWVGEKL